MNLQFTHSIIIYTLLVRLYVLSTHDFITPMSERNKYLLVGKFPHKDTKERNMTENEQSFEDSTHSYGKNQILQLGILIKLINDVL
eukprot:GAHX01005919.1.p1 GENE.GAHX01005919.1~~GAHX01005919.1.p1  ORF type:complete len:86 (-),score=3.94 GAHX01005919.1:38-295(-)